MKKKIVSLMLVLAMAVTALVGCGSSEEPADAPAEEAGEAEGAGEAAGA